MSKEGMGRRERARALYGPLQERTLRNVLIMKLIEGYGYSDKLEIAKRLVDDILETVDEYYPPADRLKPGQMVWFARAKDEKGGSGKTTGDMRAVRTILDLVTEEELEVLATTAQVKDLDQERMVRIAKDAERCGGLLSQADISIITLRSTANVSHKMKTYRKKKGKIPPTTGYKLDIGPGITHKAEAIELYAKGYSPLEVSRKIDHDLSNVERYIDTMERVKILVAKESVHTIARLLKISPSLVESYIEIIKRYWPDAVRQDVVEKE